MDLNCSQYFYCRIMASFGGKLGSNSRVFKENFQVFHLCMGWVNLKLKFRDLMGSWVVLYANGE